MVDLDHILIFWICSHVTPSLRNLVAGVNLRSTIVIDGTLVQRTSIDWSRARVPSSFLVAWHFSHRGNSSHACSNWRMTDQLFLTFRDIVISLSRHYCSFGLSWWHDVHLLTGKISKATTHVIGLVPQLLQMIWMLVELRCWLLRELTIKSWLPVDLRQEWLHNFLRCTRLVCRLLCEKAA